MNKTLRQCGLVVSAFVIASSGLFLGVPARAASPDSLYSYVLDGSVSTVANQASANTSVNLKLQGSWSQSAFGVHFAGNTTNQMSVGFAKPTSGNTINIPANQAMAAVIKFKYQKPSTGNCFSDSPNISQIGKFGAGLSQIKLQLSNCSINSTNVFPQCRVAGTTSTVNDFPVTATHALVDGETYVLRCVKSPDPATGRTPLALTVTRVNESLGNPATTNNFTLNRVGALTSTAYVSVAQKYPTPSQSANTDQFVGDVARFAYCKGATVDAAIACADTEVPIAPVVPSEPPVDPPEEEEPSVPPAPPTTYEWVGNRSVEIDMSGWTGKYTASPYVSVTRTTEGARTGAASIKVTGLSGANNLNSGFMDNPRWSTNTVAGKVYTASVWMKPQFVGQTMLLRLREWRGSTLVADTKIIHTATSTDWQKVSHTQTATGSGNQMNMLVYGSDIDAGESFLIDDLSLTTPL